MPWPNFISTFTIFDNHAFKLVSPKTFNRD